MNPSELVFIFLIALAMFHLPLVIAFRRRHPQRFAIAALNLLLGFTGIGWCLALIWSLTVVRTA